MNTKDKLIDKIEDVLEKFYHDEQYEMEDGVEAILALISQERERVLKEVEEKLLKRDEVVKTAKTVFDGTKECIYLARATLKAEQRKALSDIGGKGK